MDRLLREERFEELVRLGVLPRGSQPPRKSAIERLVDRARLVLTPARRAEPGTLTIRHAGPADRAAVARLAEMEERAAPSGTLLVAEVELEIDSPRWMGTAVRLRSGKALGDDRRCVVLRARDSDDQLVLGLAPASISLRVGDMTLRSLPAAPEPSAYARVLADLFAGDRRWFVSGAEAEEQWRIVAPVLERWSRDEPELGEYPAGSQGIVG
ncbi:MAG: hypothetical protein WD670_05300 [Actinomycetota bacterium]